MSRAAGEYTRKIKIAERGVEVDALNQPLDAWTIKFQLWSKPRSKTGMSSVRAAEAGINASPTLYSFRINYRPTGITTAMRVEDGDGNLFDIREIIHDIANHEWTDLVCETGGNNG
jgi:SPP1 family predicted phage head-tail adaptor